MRLKMETRKSVAKVMAQGYKKATKKKKGMILHEFIRLTDYNRKYAGYVLRMEGKKVWIKREICLQADTKKKTKRKRPRVYDKKVFITLLKIWIIMNYICGKRLVCVLEEVIVKLEQHQEIEIDNETRQKLKRISASSIDRLLAEEKRKLRIKSRSRTKPGTLLKHQVPIRTFAEWNDNAPGFIEIDLVGHDGGDAWGEYIQSLNVVDVCTAWTETVAVRNKAQIWVFDALKEIRTRMPFDLLGIDSDNGAEFINAHLLKYCNSEGLTFTRTRPYRKNDNCHVEQKNYSVVRQYVGYLRYDTDEERKIMNDLYRDLRLYLNYFHPVAKLTLKQRQGSKVKKEYDPPKTPYQRVLESDAVPGEFKERLKQVYAQLNPAGLKRKITKAQNNLFNTSVSKQKREKENPSKRPATKQRTKSYKLKSIET